MLHSLCVSEPFAALPPLRIAELYIAFAVPISAHLCLCLSEQSVRYYAVANPYFASPLPCPPRPSVHILRVAYPCLAAAFPLVAHRCLAAANIASHAAAKPAYSLPLRSTSNLYSAVATHCIQSLCVPSIARPSLCFATQLQVMPSLHTAVEAFAEHSDQCRCHQSSSWRHPAIASHGVSLRCPAIPLLGWAFHSNSPRRPCRQSQSQPCCAIALLCRSRPLPAPPSHLIEHFVGEPSLSGIPPLADASEPSVVQPLHNSGKMCLLV